MNRDKPSYRWSFYNQWIRPSQLRKMNWIDFTLINLSFESQPYRGGFDCWELHAGFMGLHFCLERFSKLEEQHIEESMADVFRRIGGEED